MSKLLNRDTLTLMFDQRVAIEGMRNRHTLGSRIEFFGIAFSNLREFMQVRYPALLTEAPETAQTIRDTVEGVYQNIGNAFKEFNNKRKLIRRVSDLNKSDRKWVNAYFEKNISPALLPVTVNDVRKPSIHNGLYVMVATSKDDQESIGYVEVPTCLPRFVRVKQAKYVVAIEDLIITNLKVLYSDRKIVCAVPFAIARSAEIIIQSDRYKDPFQMIQETLKERENSWVTLVEIGSKNYSKKIRKLLSITDDTVVIQEHLVRLGDLKSFPMTILNEDQQPKRFKPYDTVQTENMFDYVKKKDRLFFHPFESYDDSVVRFIEEASEDPDVVSIRICLYRVSNRSRIVDALLKAAENGKLVVALIELKARFDEKHNMEIATIMREGGVRIVYTKPDIKTHAKLCLVCRNEKKGLRIYSHVGTGNYSEVNSRIYTDYSYFTADQSIGSELTRFFNLLTSDSGDFKSRRVVYAPYNLKSTIVDEINKQIRRAKNGKRAQIICKCNALTDEGFADRLIDAAKAGVKLKLIVRTACIIEPQKNIEVYSIVGQFLEHSRIYAFGNGKHSQVYIGSADLMTRNLSRRNELLLKIDNGAHKERILKHIKWYMEDTENKWTMKTKYRADRYQTKKGDKSVDCHQLFRKEAKELMNG